MANAPTPGEAYGEPRFDTTHADDEHTFGANGGRIAPDVKIAPGPEGQHIVVPYGVAEHLRRFVQGD